MYRDGLQAALDRYHAARERVDELHSRLAADQPGLQLPADVQQRLEELASQLEPQEQTVEAIAAAEEALDEYEQLLVFARTRWKQQRREERRRRYHQAFADIKQRKWPRRVKIGLTIVVAAVLLVAIHHITLSVSCLSSEGCALYGACSPEFLGDQCLAKSNEDCANSKACRDDGQCTAALGLCLALTDYDCQRSNACRHNGRCTAEGGHCRKAEP